MNFFHLRNIYLETKSNLIYQHCIFFLSPTKIMEAEITQQYSILCRQICQRKKKKHQWWCYHKATMKWQKAEHAKELRTCINIVIIYQFLNAW